MNKKLFLSLFLLVGFLLISSLPVQASLIEYYETVYDTDYASAGVSGIRGQSSDDEADITLSGVSGTVNKAYLYWHGPSNDTDTGAMQNIKINGNDISGDHIGIADDNCWGCTVSHAYRADVTDYVSGDGTYTLSELPSFNLGDTSDMNGLSLMVFYDDGDTTNNRDIVIFNGNDSNIYSSYDPQGWDVTLNGIDYDTGSAYIELHVGDGQESSTSTSWDDDDVLLNGNILLEGPDIFMGTSLPDDGTASSYNGGLWDIIDTDITSFLVAGVNDLNLTTGVYGDCLSLVVANINLPAGAAPSVPEPATMLLVASGLAGLAGFRRKFNKK
jgi:hypothetical protein